MSLRYLLDTNVLSDFVRGERRVATKLRAARPDTLAVSSITTMELEYGLALHAAQAARLKPLVDALLGAMATLPFTVSDASAAAQVRAVLRKRGRPIGPYDVLIAGCALARGLVLVTSNTAEFERVEGLELVDWRK